MYKVYIEGWLEAQKREEKGLVIKQQRHSYKATFVWHNAYNYNYDSIGQRNGIYHVALCVLVSAGALTTWHAHYKYCAEVDHQTAATL